MKKVHCPSCGKKHMKAVRMFNDDRSTWKRNKRPGWYRTRIYRSFSKFARPSRYTVVLRCENSSCPELVLRGRSRRVVHKAINRMRRAA